MKSVVIRQPGNFPYIQLRMKAILYVSASDHGLRRVADLMVAITKCGEVAGYTVAA
jgi:hypothetical protein